VKSLQHELTRDIVSGGKLNAQQADWITNEITKTNNAVTKTFNDAMCRRLQALKSQQVKKKYLSEIEVSLMVFVSFVPIASYLPSNGHVIIFFGSLCLSCAVMRHNLTVIRLLMW
jgi:hypothetical protein